MEEFLENLIIGEIIFRDRWQFELKSEFTPPASKIDEAYSQEFYFFVPEALQINDQTYKKEDFYQDQTNLIRYKTPEFSLDQLLDPYNSLSPLTIIHSYINAISSQEALKEIQSEIKLYGNMVRSALRNKIREFVELTKSTVSRPNELLYPQVVTLAEKLRQLQLSFKEAKQNFERKWNNPLLTADFLYVEEFLANTQDYYFTGFLEYIRSLHRAKFFPIDQEICKILIEQNKEAAFPSLNDESEQGKTETILYRKGLLKKFVLDALMLNVNRASLHQRYGGLIGGFAAGLAMLVYISFFVWQGALFVINSAPFIIITVILYILKDRLKEEVKSISLKRALKWFSDYTTKIYSPEGMSLLGEIKESFSFASIHDLPEEIIEMRNKGFHELLEQMQRQEHIFYYKKNITLLPQEKKQDPRKQDLNIFFRLNIQRFLAKASEPYYSFTLLDHETHELKKTELPKVYHLNIILKTTYKQSDQSKQIEYKKFRIIVDKNGIRHIEHVMDLSNKI